MSKLSLIYVLSEDFSANEPSQNKCCVKNVPFCKKVS